MSRKIALFCLLAGVLAFIAGPVYAEVQNIKISGDITAMGVYRNNYDLEGGRMIAVNAQPNIGALDYLEDDQDSFLMSIIRLRVDADLTDNVAATIGLANLREWDNDDNRMVRPASGIPYDPNNASATAWPRLQRDVVQDEASIILDLAYITLKEMLYSPLTLVIGRQNLSYGTGMIVGNGLYRDPNNSIAYNDLSVLHGYDAVRAVLDYDPWTLDLVFAKMQEGDDIRNYPFVNTLHGADRDSDTDLYGVNVGYQFPGYNAEMEGYFWALRDQDYDLRLGLNNVQQDRIFEETMVYTAGLRGSMEPKERFTLMGEIAGQFGEILDEDQQDYPGAPSSLKVERDRQGLLAHAGANYDFADTRLTPYLSLDYLFTSGEDIGDEAAGEALDTDDFHAWHPMYRGKTMGTIRDCLELVAATNDPADTSGFTNQHTVKVGGGVDLGEFVSGLRFDMAFLKYWFDECPSWDNRDTDIGCEVDCTLTYDYTEDVQFCLDGAWFIPGDYYDQVHTTMPMEGGDMNLGPDYGRGTVTYSDAANAITNRVANDNAVSIIGSCKVNF